MDASDVYAYFYIQHIICICDYMINAYKYMYMFTYCTKYQPTEDELFFVVKVRLCMIGGKLEAAMGYPRDLSAKATRKRLYLLICVICSTDLTPLRWKRPPTLWTPKWTDPIPNQVSFLGGRYYVVSFYLEGFSPNPDWNLQVRHLGWWTSKHPGYSMLFRGSSGEQGFEPYWLQLTRWLLPAN